jgi:arylsulfatase A-like enzyme
MTLSRGGVYGLGWVCLAIVLGYSTSEVHSQPAASAGKPNILFISADDMNDWLSVLGGHAGMKIHTPNLDRLARSSTVFTNAHTPAPACAPARTAIMSGVHAARIGAENVYWGDGPRWRSFGALRSVETLEQFFKNRGYLTLGGGKIYHSQAPPWSPTSQVEPQNWDFYYPSAYISHPHQVRPPRDVIFPERVDNATRPGGEWWTWGPIPADDTKMADYHVVDWASYELSRKHDKPFFLAVGVWKPHDPWEVPQKYFDMYPLEKIVLPEIRENDLTDAFDHGRRRIHQWVLDNDEWARVVQAYAASITFADAVIGRLLDALEKSPHARNTAIVFWSDHGMHMGQKENFEKFTLWELSTRVPLMIRAPGLPGAGTRIDRPVSLMDIYPTLSEIAGFAAPSHTDGTSLVPLIKDPQTKRPPVITSYRFSDRPEWHLGQSRDAEVGHAVRSERYRYIYYTVSGLEELYDHRTDPNEWENVAYKPENRQVIREHRRHLLEMLPEMVWRDGEPVGYTVNADGSVEKKNFIPISPKPRGRQK